MRTLIPAFLLAATLTCALAEEPAPQGDPPPPPAPAEAPSQTGDQAALEAQDREPEHTGPTWGQSRAERYREKCRAIADQQGLKGAARDKHMKGCVKK